MLTASASKTPRGHCVVVSLFYKPIDILNICYSSLMNDSAFYRTMHYSGKPGIEIACRLSVRPSETLVDHDHISWKSWKLIARTIILAQHLRSS